MIDVFEESDAQEADDTVSDYQFYNSILFCIAQENSLVSKRIEWGVVFSAALIAASAILGNLLFNLTDDRNYLGMSVVLFLMGIISGLGIYFSLSVLRGVSAAFFQIEYLRSLYRSRKRKVAFKVLPRPYGDHHEYNWGAQSAKAFPIVMLVVWILAGVVELGVAVWLLPGP